MKQIFTRTQAVSVLAQVNNGTREISLMAPVDPKHRFFNLSNEQLFAKLSEIIDSDGIADVVDEVGSKATAE